MSIDIFKTITAVTLVTASGITQAATLLGPTPYLSASDSPFNTTNFDYFYLEDFEDGLLNTPGVSSLGGSSTGPGGLTDSVDADDGLIDGSGTNGRSFFGSGVTGITFTFDANTLGVLPTYVGIVWTDGAITNEVTFEAFDSNGILLGNTIAPGIGDNSFLGGTAEDRFFGITDPLGISSIHIFNSAMSGGGSGIEVDHLQYGAAVVPVPASIWLFGSGIFGLIGLARRNKS